MADPPRKYQRLFADLKRRRVFRVMALYGAAAFAVLQAVDLLVPVIGLSDSVTQGAALLLLLGAPVAILLGWAFDLTPKGVQRAAEATPGELAEIIRAPISKRWTSGLLALAGMVALMAGAWLVGRQSVTVQIEDGTAKDLPSIAIRSFSRTAFPRSS
jgi:hypothetical protein